MATVKRPPAGDMEHKNKRRVIMVNYTHAEGATSKVTMWEIPADMKNGTPFDELLNYFEESLRSKKQKRYNEHTSKLDAPGKPYAYIFDVEEVIGKTKDCDATHWELFDREAAKYFTQIPAPFVLSVCDVDTQIVFVQVVDAD